MIPAAPARAPWMRRAGLAAGILLLAGAVLTVVLQRDSIGRAAEAVAHPSIARLALLGGAIAANLVLTGLTFSVLMSRHGRVGLFEMQALIAAATLMNFVPLRPGLVGRIAWHRAFNAIPAAASITAVVTAMALSGAAAGWMAAALLAGRYSPGMLPMLVAGPVPVLAACLGFPRLRVWAAAGLLRYLEVAVWAARYYASFALLGSPIGWDGALALGCVSMVAMLAPLAGNGLGVREWAIGLAAPLLAASHLEMGLAADLVNRAAELVVILPAGLAGAAWLSRRVRCADHCGPIRAQDPSS